MASFADTTRRSGRESREMLGYRTSSNKSNHPASGDCRSAWTLTLFADMTTPIPQREHADSVGARVWRWTKEQMTQ
jgi:hypothetical protein